MSTRTACAARTSSALCALFAANSSATLDLHDALAVAVHRVDERLDGGGISDRPVGAEKRQFEGYGILPAEPAASAVLDCPSPVSRLAQPCGAAAAAGTLRAAQGEPAG